jgi:thiamine biosynthesis lipoprotein
VLDEVLHTLADLGIDAAMVIGGGDIACSGPPPGRQGWRVRVAPGRGAPETELELAHAAVATSGDSERGFELDGVRYSHVIDPRTGEAMTRGGSATVVAREGMTADAWASALCVLGPAGLERLEPELAARVVVPGPEGCFISRENDAFGRLGRPRGGGPVISFGFPCWPADPGLVFEVTPDPTSGPIHR